MGRETQEEVLPVRFAFWVGWGLRDIGCGLLFLFVPQTQFLSNTL